MKMILPCAGLSARFKSRQPKWMMTHPNGSLMIQAAIAGIDFSYIHEVRMVVCKDQLKDGLTEEVLLEILGDALPPGMAFHLDVLQLRTKSQAETVYACLLHNQIEGSFFVKDCDNYFKTCPRPANTVTVMEVAPESDIRRLQQKSFIETDALGQITRVVEKQIVSDTFCVGGYSFQSAEYFITAYQACMAKTEFNNRELYLSSVIQWMIDRGDVFSSVTVADSYQDWGTIEEWNHFKASWKTVVCDIDGVLLKNASKYMEPRWGASEPLTENLDALRSLDPGRTTIVLLTARGEEYRQVTESQLKALGLRFHALVMGLPHAKRILVNDFNDATAPYPMAESVNIFRDDRRLAALLK